MGENREKYIYILADYILVESVKRSAIYDLSRSHIHIITTDFYLLATLFEDYTIGEIMNSLISEYDKKEFSSFVPFLPKEEMAVVIENPIHDFISIFNQLSDLNCSNVQLRFFKSIHCNIETLSEILFAGYHTSVLGMEIYLLLHWQKQSCILILKNIGLSAKIKSKPARTVSCVMPVMIAEHSG